LYIELKLVAFLKAHLVRCSMLYILLLCHFIVFCCMQYSIQNVRQQNDDNHWQDLTLRTARSVHTTGTLLPLAINKQQWACKG